MAAGKITNDSVHGSKLSHARNKRHGAADMLARDLLAYERQNTQN